MKKILILFFLCFFLFPLMNTKAATNGLLNNKNLTIFTKTVYNGSVFSNEEITDPTNISSNKLTDNSTSTSFKFSSNTVSVSYIKSAFFEFKTTASINGYMVNSDKSINFALYDKNLNVLYNTSIARIDGTKVNISQIDNVKYVRFYAVNLPVNYEIVSEVDVFGTETVKVIPADVTDIATNTFYNKVDLSWTLPNINNFKQVNIYRDNVKIASTTNSTYTDNAVNENTKYEYVVKVESTDDVESNGVSISATTKVAKASGEVTNLVADAKYNQVALSWKIPNDGYFAKAKIYRDGIYIASTTSNSYTDKNLKDNKSYEYKITTVSVENNVESNGVKITATTTMSPAQEIKGGGYTVGETGDYTYSWTAPTEGKVKVMVGGQLYATVDASDLQITIPKIEMKYKALGDPDVSLIPVTPGGVEGKPTQPTGDKNTVSNTKLPFGASDTLNAGVMLLVIIAPFLLLALAFLVVPSLRKIVVDALSGGNSDIKGRRTKGEVLQRDPVMKEERMKIERTERDRTARKRTIGRRVM